MLSPDELNPDYYTSILILIVSPLWQIIDSGKEKSIGKLEFPLTQLIKSESMTIEQPFPLRESGHNSTLSCKFMLKVNFPEKSLPQLLPKDQCPSLGYYECLNLTNQFQKTTLDRDCKQSHCLCEIPLGRIHYKWAVWAWKCEAANHK